MQALETLQRDFYEAVFDNRASLKFVSSEHPSERFYTYRNTILTNMRNALSITFPGTWQLLGKSCADSAANAFTKVKSNQPTTGCLDDWGCDFPEFLSRQEQLKTLPYLKDYATYEWLKQKAYMAKSAEAINAADLAMIPETKVDDTCFVFMPSFALFSSDFCIMDIDEVATNPDAKPIDSIYRKSYSIVARPNDIVLSLWISEDLWYFCAYLEDGFTLDDTCKKLEKQYPDFDLAAAIHFLVEQQLIYKIFIIGGINEN